MRPCVRLITMLLAVAAWRPDAANAQVVNPATQQPAAETKTDQPSEEHHTWQMPPVDVYGKAPLKEDDRIGDYAQPRWTADRLFSETRVYVIPKGKVEFEYWLIPETPRDGPTDDGTRRRARARGGRRRLIPGVARRIRPGRPIVLSVRQQARNERVPWRLDQHLRCPMLAGRQPQSSNDDLGRRLLCEAQLRPVTLAAHDARDREEAGPATRARPASDWQGPGAT